MIGVAVSETPGSAPVLPDSSNGVESAEIGALGHLPTVTHSLGLSMSVHPDSDCYKTPIPLHNGSTHQIAYHFLNRPAYSPASTDAVPLIAEYALRPLLPL